MALINCPECGEKISDKVKVCPHCGYPMIDCENDNPSIPQQVEVTGVKIYNPKAKRYIIIFLILISLIITSIIAISFFKMQREKRAHEKSYNTYIDNLALAQTTMLLGGSDAENLINLVLKVWSNSIYEERDDETDKYTRPNGSFVSDFNDALGNLFVDNTTNKNISDIKDNQSLAEDIMKKLQSPPDELEKCYETITDLYSAYKGVTDLAINPTGSYSSYAEDKNTKIDNFMSAYDKLSTQIPDKMEKDNEKIGKED